MSGGFKGRENVYTCMACGSRLVTVDRDEGTTPMFLRCGSYTPSGCGGDMASSGYPNGPRPPHIPAPSVTVRQHNQARRAFVKIAEPNVWRERAKVVWETINGRPLPRGFVVHHKDRDPLNDSPENLEAMTRRAHLLEHRAEVSAWRA